MPTKTERAKLGHVSPFGKNPLSAPSAPRKHLSLKAAPPLNLFPQHDPTRDKSRPYLARWCRDPLSAPSRLPSCIYRGVLTASGWHSLWTPEFCFSENLRLALLVPARFLGFPTHGPLYNTTLYMTAAEQHPSLRLYTPHEPVIVFRGTR